MIVMAMIRVSSRHNSRCTGVRGIPRTDCIAVQCPIFEQQVVESGSVTVGVTAEARGEGVDGGALHIS